MASQWCFIIDRTAAVDYRFRSATGSPGAARPLAGRTHVIAIIVSSHIEAGLLGGPVIDLQKTSPKLAEYIDKLLQGRAPEKLPIFLYAEKYMINLNTAADLDLEIPVKILSQATIIRETQP